MVCVECVGIEACNIVAKKMVIKRERDFNKISPIKKVRERKKKEKDKIE